MTYLVSRPATADLRDIRDWIAGDDPKRAVVDLGQLEALFARLGSRPFIEISRVLHGRRDLRRVTI